jgi:hypothetical protein
VPQPVVDQIETMCFCPQAVMMPLNGMGVGQSPISHPPQIIARKNYQNKALWQLIAEVLNCAKTMMRL